MREANWAKCFGSAHNPFIDHCMVCLPFWASYPVCPDCEAAEDGYGSIRPVALTMSASRKTGKCPTCKKQFRINRESETRKHLETIR